jgi:hypothetical protein
MSEYKKGSTCNSCKKYVGTISKGLCCAKPPFSNSYGEGLFPKVFAMVSWCFEYEEIRKPIPKKKPVGKKAIPLPPKQKGVK